MWSECNHQEYYTELYMNKSRTWKQTQRKVEQESPAIAKMTARCALYMDALKNFGSPWLRPRLLFPKLLMTLVVIDRMKVHPDGPYMLGSARAEALSYSALKLFSKNSNLCDYGT